MKNTNIIFFQGLLCLTSLRGAEVVPFSPPQKVRVHNWSSQALGQTGPNCTLYSLHNGLKFLGARRSGVLPIAEDLLSFPECNEWRWKAIAMRDARGRSVKGAEDRGISIDERKGLAQLIGVSPSCFTDIYPYNMLGQSIAGIYGDCSDDETKLRRAVRNWHTHDYSCGPFAHLFLATKKFSSHESEDIRKTPHAVACVASSRKPGELFLDYIDSSELGSRDEITKIARYLIASLSTQSDLLTGGDLREQCNITAQIREDNPPLLPSREKSTWNRFLNWCRNLVGLPVRYGKLSSLGDSEKLYHAGLFIVVGCLVGSALRSHSSASATPHPSTSPPR